MAFYRVEFRGSAERELHRIDLQMVPRIMEAIRGLAEEPRPSGTRKLAGFGAGLPRSRWRLPGRLHD
jgi:mRNA interferase RelE/StbE